MSDLLLERRSDEGVNEAFVREVLAWIEIHQEQWDQRGWARDGVCGTAYCFAGWAYVLGTGDWFTVDWLNRVRAQGDVLQTAARLLGLSEHQANALFYFTSVLDETHGSPGYVRRPTFKEFCDAVENVTGIRFKEPTDGG